MQCPGKPKVMNGGHKVSVSQDTRVQDPPSRASQERHRNLTLERDCRMVRKRQGRISQESARWSQDDGQPIRSIQDEQEPSGLSQVKAIESGCKERQMSETERV